MKIELKDGEIICSKCEGIPIFCKTSNQYVDKHYCDICTIDNYTKCTGSRKCQKCNGEGKLDWIENIVGKKDHASRNTTRGFYIIEEDLSERLYFPTFKVFGKTLISDEILKENKNDE